MKTFKLIMGAALILGSFTACSDNDDNNETIDFSSPSDKKISKLTMNFENKTYLCSKFTYTDGKITGYTNIDYTFYSDSVHVFIGKADTVDYKIEYPESNKVSLYFSYSNLPYLLYNCEYTLNDKGYADSSVSSARYVHIPEQEPIVYSKCQYKYTPEGFLSSWENINGDYNLRMNIKYENNNVISHVYQVIKEGEINDYISNYTYTSYPNKNGILPQTTYINTWPDNKIAYYLGILGKPTQNLPAVASGSSGIEESFNYTFTKEGNISNFTKKISIDGFKLISASYQYEYE